MLASVMSTGAGNGTRSGSGGDRDFARLYSDVVPSLVAWANLRIPSSMRRLIDPEDVVQDVTFRAYSKFARFDETRGPFRHWFFGVANNVIKELYATAAKLSEKAPREPSAAAALAEVPDDVTSISQRVVRDEGLKAFVAKLDTLDNVDRKLLIYRGIEDLGHAETAVLLGITRVAVEKRWQRLVEKIEEFKPPPDLFRR